MTKLSYLAKGHTQSGTLCYTLAVVSAPAEASCSLATLTHSNARVNSERHELISCRSSLFSLPSQSFPYIWFNLNRRSAHTVFTESSYYLIGKVKQWGNCSKWNTRTSDSTSNLILQENGVTWSAISDALRSWRKLYNRTQSWNRKLCLVQMIDWNLISDTANKFRNCLLLTAAFSILCAEQWNSVQKTS